jgi:hypothetical protein
MTRMVTLSEAHLHHDSRSRATRLAESHHASAASVKAVEAQASVTRVGGVTTAASVRPPMVMVKIA